MTLVTESTQVAPELASGAVIPYQSILNAFKDLAIAAPIDANIAAILLKYGIAVYGSDGTQLFPVVQNSALPMCDPSSPSACGDTSQVVVTGSCVASSNNICTAGVPSFVFTMTLASESAQVASGLGPGDVIPYQSILNSFKDLAMGARMDAKIAAILYKYGITVYGSDGTQVFPQVGA
jgi:hypothetical protein